MTAKVLFVDDEQNILSSLQRLFMDEDFCVDTAGSGGEALAILGGGGDYAAIVSDQRMPGMTGTEFLARARELAPDARRILLTGYADINATIDAINRGGAGRYITKPWNDGELLQAIRESVETHRLLRENRRLADVVNRQNEELKEWNGNLKQRVLAQTSELRRRNDELSGMVGRLKQNLTATIGVLSSLIELHNRGMESHSRNVSLIAERAARLHGLPDDDAEIIGTAALLHDIGKIGTYRETVLQGIDELSGNALAEYRLHPVRGEMALAAVEELREASLLIRHHHECFDGSGFPDRLQGSAIPIGAQLIGMADWVENGTRRHAADNRVDLALAELNMQLGSRFDPALYPAIAGALREVDTVGMSRTGMIEMAVPPSALRAGMVLARELHSGTGLFLLSKGTVLDPAKIHALEHYFRLDPPRDGITVLVAG